MVNYLLQPSIAQVVGVSYPTADVTVQTMLFEMTEADLWLTEYLIYGPASNPIEEIPSFALWAPNGSESGLICSSAAQVTASSVPGTGWVSVPLPEPTLLSPQVVYAAGYSLNGNFPSSSVSLFGSGGIYAGGYVSGPFSVYSNGGGTAPDPWDDAQCAVATSGTIDTVYPTGAGGTAGFYCGIGLGVTSTPPSSGTVWPFPNYPSVSVYGSTEPLSYTLGWEHYVTQATPAVRCWHYSPPGLTGGLPTWAGIWDTTTQSIVWQNAAPAWSGAAGSGWVSTPISGFTPVANRLYRGSTFLNAGSETWFTAMADYYSTGPGANGFNLGPLIVPTTNSWYNQGSALAYPNTTGPESDFSGIIEYEIPAPITSELMPWWYYPLTGVN